MRILEFVDGVDGGGTGKIVYDYVKHMDKTDIDIDILAFYKPDRSNPFLHDAFIEAGCNMLYIEGRHSGLVKHLKQFAKVLDSGKYDLIHCHSGDWSFPYLLIAKKKKIPVRIAHSHITKNEYSGIKKLIVSMMRRVLPIVTTHRYACGIDAGKYLWGKKIFTVMKNAVDCEKFRFDESVRNQMRKELGISDETKLILHIGRFCYQKNNESLIPIAENLISKKQIFKIVSVGNGEFLDQIKGLVKERHLEDYFLFLGLRSDVHRILMAADVFVLPSRFEGLPIVAIEAQASGVPTILSDRITSEAKIIDTTVFESIDNGMGKWSDIIIEISGKYEKRKTSCDLVIENGYDIVQESKCLKDCYIKYYSDTYRNNTHV